MHHDFLDRYARLDSPVHRLPAGAKLAGAVVLLILVILVPASRSGWFAPIAAVLLAVAATSRVPPSFLLRRLVLMEPFVIGVGVLSWFQPGGPAIFLRLNPTPKPTSLPRMKRLNARHSPPQGPPLPSHSGQECSRSPASPLTVGPSGG